MHPHLTAAPEPEIAAPSTPPKRRGKITGFCDRGECGTCQRRRIPGCEHACHAQAAEPTEPTEPDEPAA
jgi:hypothetical protein